MIRCDLCRREVYQEDICASCERCIDCVATKGHGKTDRDYEEGPLKPKRLRSGGQVVFPLGEE
jgi:hypothetical protein